MAKNKYKGKSKASIEADKKKSLFDIEKIRCKLDAIKGREDKNTKLSPKDIIHLNKAIYELNKNKILIEDSARGTNAHKAPNWSRRPSKNKSKLQ